MNPGERNSKHILGHSWPPFLDLLESDPQEAYAGFYIFAWKLLMTLPPPPLASLSREQQEDIIVEIIDHCCKDEFQKLKKYRKQRGKFSTWLLVVAKNKTLDILKKEEKMPKVPIIKEKKSESGTRTGLREDDMIGPTSSVLDEVANREAVEIVDRLISRMSQKCQILLRGRGEGLSFPDLAVLLGWKRSQNKKAWDEWDACRQRLKELLIDEEIDLKEILPPGAPGTKRERGTADA